MEEMGMGYNNHILGIDIASPLWLWSIPSLMQMISQMNEIVVPEENNEKSSHFILHLQRGMVVSKDRMDKQFQQNKTWLP